MTDTTYECYYQQYLGCNPEDYGHGFVVYFPPQEEYTDPMPSFSYMLIV
jgi:hypothetical protein